MSATTASETRTRSVDLEQTLSVAFLFAGPVLAFVLALFFM